MRFIDIQISQNISERKNYWYRIMS